MYDVHPYFMYGFLQPITDGSPSKHPRKKDKQGEEEKRIQANTLKKTIRQ
jgi:hypothetical protein